MGPIVGIDIGYGYTKSAIYDSGKYSYDLFPTKVTRNVPKDLFTDEVLPIARVNGKTFLIGKRAELEGFKTISTRTPNFLVLILTLEF